METDPNSIEPIELDVDLSQVDTAFPVISKGTYDFDVKGIAKEENKEKKGFNLVVTFASVDATPRLNPTSESEIYEPGRVLLRKYFPLQKKEGGSDKFDYRVGLASLIDAALGTTMENRPKFNSQELIGKRVRLNVAVVESKEDDSFQNEIKRMSHPE